jgi:23S rRNA (cytosine1962-C5)-methyltransferase
MANMKTIVLKKGKEKIFRKRHHWIFSGAIASYPDGYEDGDLASICSSDGKFLGVGFFNRKASLAGRIICFGENKIEETLRTLLHEAMNLRDSLLQAKQTTAFRLINGEGDGLPGLVIDKYGPYLVTQTGTLGMRKLLPFFVQQLREILELKGIYDKSNSASLREEKTSAQDAILWGEIPEKIEILEEGSRFLVSVKKGQKTGFFLDHREMRKMIQALSSGRRVLNAFCYTGGFTVAALKGGAVSVASVDLSAAALDLCKENVYLNGYQHRDCSFHQVDVFDFLESQSCAYDLVILDPPAFAKKKKDISSAAKGYRRLFSQTLKNMSKGGLLLASSCSHFISESHFEEIVREAALHAQKAVKIISRHKLGCDHPINLFHPEGSYLKSLLLHVS